MTLLKSKKFWIGVGGLLAVVVSHFFGIAEAEINKIVAIVIAMVLGQGMADFGKAKK